MRDISDAFADKKVLFAMSGCSNDEFWIVITAFCNHATTGALSAIVWEFWVQTFLQRCRIKEIGASVIHHFVRQRKTKTGKENLIWISLQFKTDSNKGVVDIYLSVTPTHLLLACLMFLYIASTWKWKCVSKDLLLDVQWTGITISGNWI